MSRGIPVIKIECNDCGIWIECELTMLAVKGAYDSRDLDKELKSDGWTKKEDMDFCKECSR